MCMQLTRLGARAIHHNHHHGPSARFFRQLNMHTSDTAHAHEHVQLVHVKAWTGAKAEG